MSLDPRIKAIDGLAAGIKNGVPLSDELRAAIARLNAVAAVKFNKAAAEAAETEKEHA